MPDSDVRLIQKVVNGSDGVVSYKNIKSRRVGAYKDIEITLIFPSDMTILQCHDICDDIEAKLEHELGNTVVVLHAEPDCKNCAKKS